MASKLYGVNATIIIFVFVLYCILFYCIVLYCINFFVKRQEEKRRAQAEVNLTKLFMSPRNSTGLMPL